MASLVAQTVKNLPEMQETSVRSLGWESLGDPLEKLPSPVFLPGEFKRGSSYLGHKWFVQLHIVCNKSPTNLVVKFFFIIPTNLQFELSLLNRLG